MVRRTATAAATAAPELVDETPASPPPLEFEWVPRSKLRPWALNPNEGDVPGIMESLRTLGWGRPLVVNRHPGLVGELIIGHHTLQAAEQLEASGVRIPNGLGGFSPEGMAPVRWVSLPAKKAHALSLADNQRAKKGKVTADRLKAVVGADELAPEEWLAAGFSEKDIKGLMFEPWPEMNQSQLAPSLNYSVIIECDSEAQQTELLERFEAEGIRCKPWVG